MTPGVLVLHREQILLSKAVGTKAILYERAASLPEMRRDAPQQFQVSPQVIAFSPRAYGIFFIEKHECFAAHVNASVCVEQTTKTCSRRKTWNYAPRSAFDSSSS